VSGIGEWSDLGWERRGEERSGERAVPPMS